MRQVCQFAFYMRVSSGYKELEEARGVKAVAQSRTRFQHWERRSVHSVSNLNRNINSWKPLGKFPFSLLSPFNSGYKLLTTY